MCTQAQQSDAVGVFSTLKSAGARWRWTGSGAPPAVDILDCTMSIFSVELRSSESGKRAVLLTDGERATFRKQSAAAESCGGLWKSFGRVVTRDGKAMEEQMVLRTHCGRRVCWRCDREQRQHKQHRVAGPWKTIITLTVPTWRDTRAGACRAMHGWIAEFIADLRKKYNKVGLKRVRGGKLRYAWVIELTEAGYPHLHLVVDEGSVDSDWVRSNWADILGLSTVIVDVAPVKDKSAMCSYLAKYVSCVTLPNEVLAIWHHKRLWWSTIRCAKPVEDEPWIEIDRNSSHARALYMAPNHGPGGIGWKKERRFFGKMQTWMREVRDDIPVIPDDWYATLLSVFSASDIGPPAISV